MRVAVYRILYGEDFVAESIRSILPIVDRVLVAKAERPWGTSTGVRWKGEWVAWPARFDETRERIAELREPSVEVVDDFWPTPKNQHQHIVNDLVLPRYKAEEVVFVEPDHVFSDIERARALAEWIAGGYPQATTRMVELWKTPEWRVPERHRPSVLFHRIHGRRMGPTSGDGGQEGVSSHWLRAEVHNLGFCFSTRTMRWKHLTAMAFADEIADAPPDPDWYEKKWLAWDPVINNYDLEISLGGQHTIPRAIPYDSRQAPESIRRRFDF